jgi:adenylate kinase family enzyme
LVSKIPGSTLISTGDIARKLISSDAQQKEMESKDLFPGEDELRAELKSQIENTSATTIFVDGFPRSGEQATYLADTFWDLFPVVIEVSVGDPITLANRAKLRGRDNRDSDPIQFGKRLVLASKNMSEASVVLSSRLITQHTIMSTGDDNFVLNQFKKIASKTP